MKVSLTLITLFFLACQSSNEIKDLIRGNWYSYDGEQRTEITRNQYIRHNDSTIPEEYDLVGDSIIVTRFEDQVMDRMKIIKVDKDSLILLRDLDTLRLYKK